MTIWIPRFRMRSQADALWRAVKTSWVAPFLSHSAQLFPAAHLMRQFSAGHPAGMALAAGLFGRPLRGAAPTMESLMPLPYDPTATLPVDLSGANSADMMVLTNIDLLEIGLCWVVAGTATTLVMDFDLYPTAVEAGGSVTDKLDGTNGVLTAPTVASQAVGNVLYKEISDTVGAIAVTKGSSIRANVTTTVTSGTGVPYVLATPRAVNNASLATLIASS